jgi:protein-S-isoprenylcysteine O-methyltransferase Ste14
MTAVALNSDNITKIGIVIIVALVVIGALLSIVLTALVARIIILVVVIGLGILVWQQRTHIKDQVDKCKLDATFFGIHINAPDSVQQHCRSIHRQIGR